MAEIDKMDEIKEKTWKAVVAAAAYLKNPNFNTRWNFAVALRNINGSDTNNSR